MNWQDTIPSIVSFETLLSNEIVKFIKEWRSRELAASDWTQLSDVDLANKWDWAVYRQQLRDLPSQGADPKVWIFPVPPT